MNKFSFSFFKCSFFAGALVLSGVVNGQVKILFDATKGEMAGCADWIIDADQTNLGVGPSGAYTTTSGNHSNPQRIPTPAQSGITASTTETYWAGGLSAWAVDCAKRGYTVETLPWNGQITYGNTSNAQDLSNYRVYIVCEPNIVFSAAEKTALLQFVQHGGGLFMIADHNISDRNGDGWDSPHIWNDLLSSNTVQNYPFGIYFDTADFSQTTTNVSAASTDPVIHGPMGNVVKMKYSGGTTMTLNPAQNSSVKGVVYKTGATAGNTNVMFAYARYGRGKVAAMGDSSPADDSTGNVYTGGSGTCSLYNGYTGDASGNHQLLLMNATIWLADTTGASAGVEEIANHQPDVTLYPNPAHGSVTISCENPVNDAIVTIVGVAGNVIAQKTTKELSKENNITVNLEPGFYLVRVEGNQGITTSRVVIY